MSAGRSVPDGPAPHAFVADLEAPDLADDDRHHLARVLRLRDGDALTVSDGRGSWRVCRFGEPLEIAGPVETEALRQPAITVGFAVLKGDRNELVVQKLTELGVDRIVPFVAERCVVRWDDERRRRQDERWVQVARTAAMQSRRTRLPVLTPVGDFAAAADLPGAVLAQRGGDPPSLAAPVVLVGPEGGWSDVERAAGLPPVALADDVLRAETAAITAGVVLSTLRAGLVVEQGSFGRSSPPTHGE